MCSCLKRTISTVPVIADNVPFCYKRKITEWLHIQCGLFSVVSNGWACVVLCILNLSAGRPMWLASLNVGNENEGKMDEIGDKQKMLNYKPTQRSPWNELLQVNPQSLWRLGDLEWDSSSSIRDFLTPFRPTDSQPSLLSTHWLSDTGLQEWKKPLERSEWRIFPLAISYYATFPPVFRLHIGLWLACLTLLPCLVHRAH